MPPPPFPSMIVERANLPALGALHSSFAAVLQSKLNGRSIVEQLDARNAPVRPEAKQFLEKFLGVFIGSSLNMQSNAGYTSFTIKLIYLLCVSGPAKNSVFTSHFQCPI
jgi:hypothetical protein